MKKSLYKFVAVLIITFAVPLHAQRTYVGVLGGSNFADLDIDFVDGTITNYDVQSRTLLGVGGFFGIYLNEFLSIQFEPMFVEKGGVFTQQSVKDILIKSNQIELPLVLKAETGGKTRLYIIGGISISFILDASIETEMAGLLWKGNLTEILDKTEFGALLGTGISFPIWNGLVFIECRYAFGLTNLNKGGNLNLTSGNLIIAGPQTDPKDEIKTMGIQIMLGYQLPISWE